MTPNDLTCDTIVVGSGPGGASVAKGLAEQGQKVAIVEMGDNQPLQGSFLQMAKMAAIPGRGAFVHKDLSLVMRAITTGGSSVINFATAMPPPFERFQALGINLTEAYQLVQQQLPLAPLPDQLIGPMAQRIMDSALDLGLNWQKLDKFIKPEICRSQCHRCAYGCPHNAKWSARMWIDEAQSNGALLMDQAKVERVLHKDGKAIGIEYRQHGLQKKLYAKNVVLAAGGIGSPRILAQSGFDNVSKNYFVDPVIAVMGSVKKITGGNEIPMSAGLHLAEQGITLSDLTLPRPLYQTFSLQAGRVHRLLSHEKALTVMVKIADQSGGKIGPHWINKSLSEQDKNRLAVGYEMAHGILENSGAKGIFKTHHFAAHPGGSVGIDKNVDSNLQTDIKGLYVCDASILPSPWGIAPSLTLLCLGARLALHLGGGTVR